MKSPVVVELDLEASANSMCSVSIDTGINIDLSVCYITCIHIFLSSLY